MMRDFAAMAPEEARKKYSLRDDTRDWKIADAQADLKRTGCREDHVKPILYRPFDSRWIYYTEQSKGVLCMPRGKIMRQMLLMPNLGLVSVRQVAEGNFNHVFVADTIIGNRVTYSSAGTTYLFPLYVMQENGIKDYIPARTANFSDPFLAFLAERYCSRKTPEEVLGYIYAILHSMNYRRRYIDFLEVDFPRILFVDCEADFDVLGQLGSRLINLHMMRQVPSKKGCFFQNNPTLGSDIMVEKVRYDQHLRQIWINAECGFSGVAPADWRLRIGGYQVLKKYLQDRKGRCLSLDEITHLEKVIGVLAESAEISAEIDRLFMHVFPEG